MHGDNKTIAAKAVPIIKSIKAIQVSLSLKMGTIEITSLA